MNKQYRDKKARDVYLENRSTAKGADMIKENHVKTKDITSDMKLFKETKEDSIISTYFNRIEILSGNETQIIML
jgi:hypothetical protein